MKILHLTVKRKWFDLIASGKKSVEYRECKPYWEKRLLNDDGSYRVFDIVRFKNGYGKNVPTMDVEFRNMAFTDPERHTPKHGEVLGGTTIMISLGKVLSLSNHSP